MQTIVRKEKRQRTVVGTLFKCLFVAFNIFMVVWMIGGYTAVSSIKTSSPVDQLVHFIGVSIGFTFVLLFWVLGDIVLGILVLATRGNKVIIEETIGGRHAGESLEDTNTAQVDDIIARYKRQREMQSSIPTQPAVSAQAPARSASGTVFGKRQ